MFSVHPALPPCLGLTTRRGTQGDITGGMECRRAPQDGQVPPTTSRRRPCAGACVPPPAPSVCLGGGGVHDLSGPPPWYHPGLGCPRPSVSSLPCPVSGLSQPRWGSSWVTEHWELGLEWKAPAVGDGGDPPPLCPPPRAEAMAVRPPRTLPSLLSLPSALSASYHCMSLLWSNWSWRDACIHPVAAVL